MFGSKNLLMNVTKTNEHSNVATYVRALLTMYVSYLIQYHLCVLCTHRCFVNKTTAINYINGKSQIKKLATCSTCLIGLYSFISHEKLLTASEADTYIDKSNYSRNQACIPKPAGHSSGLNF